MQPEITASVSSQTEGAHQAAKVRLTASPGFVKDMSQVCPDGVGGNTQPQRDLGDASPRSDGDGHLRLGPREAIGIHHP